MEGTEGVSLIHILRKERKSKGFLLSTDILNSCYLRFIFFSFTNRDLFPAKIPTFWQKLCFAPKRFGEKIWLCCSYTAIFRDLRGKHQLLLLAESLPTAEGASLIVFLYQQNNKWKMEIISLMASSKKINGIQFSSSWTSFALFFSHHAPVFHWWRYRRRVRTTHF